MVSIMNDPIPSKASSHRDRRYTVTLVNRIHLSEQAFEIELTRPDSLDFVPGHNIRFQYKDLERYYSIISKPAEPRLRLLVRLVDRGIFSNVLASADIGNQFELTGPHGYFTFKPSSRPPVFVATDTGIAPFVSMASSGIQDFILFHEVVHPKNLYYKSVFRRSRCRYFPCVSNVDAADRMPSGTLQGNVSKCILKDLRSGEFDFYLCGRREMIRDLTKLVDDSFPGSLVFKEVFF